MPSIGHLATLPIQDKTLTLTTRSSFKSRGNGHDDDATTHEPTDRLHSQRCCRLDSSLGGGIAEFANECQ